jgi:hypothetical protein
VEEIQLLQKVIHVMITREGTLVEMQARLHFLHCYLKPVWECASTACMAQPFCTNLPTVVLCLSVWVHAALHSHGQPSI